MTVRVEKIVHVNAGRHVNVGERAGTRELDGIHAGFVVLDAHGWHLERACAELVEPGRERLLLFRIGDERLERGDELGRRRLSVGRSVEDECCAVRVGRHGA